MRLSKNCSLILASALFGTLLLTACAPAADVATEEPPAVSSEESTYESAPAFEQEPETEDAPEEESEEAVFDNTINGFTEPYELFLPVRTADEALEITRLDVPSEIGGYYVSCVGLTDEHTFLVLLYSSEGALLNYAEYGLYDMDTGEYRSLFETDDHCSILAYNSGYIVLEQRTVSPATLKEEAMGLYLFDISENTRREIYWNTYEGIPEQEIHWVLDAALLGDKVYYDEGWYDGRSGRQSDIYAYDIAAGETEKLMEGAGSPIVSGDDLLFLTKKDGEFSHLSSLSGEYDCDIGGVPQLAAGGGKVFALITEGEDEKNPVYALKELTSGGYILKTDRTAAFLSCGDTFTAFVDYGLDSRPMVCDTRNSELIVFEDMDCVSYAWLFYGDIGVLSCYDSDSEERYYMFRLREEAVEGFEPQSSEAEQIYAALRGLADFEHYMNFVLAEDIDHSDHVDVEKLYLPYAGLPEEKIGTSYSVTYYRVAGGRMSDGVSLARWIDSFASKRYTAKELSDWFGRNFTVSDGKIYASPDYIENAGGWGYTEGLALREFSYTEDEMLLLSFGYTSVPLDTEHGQSSAGSFTVTLEKEGGAWKIYDCDLLGKYALVNEFFFNDEQSGLPEQIDRMLGAYPEADRQDQLP